MGQSPPISPWTESVNILVVDDQPAKLLSYEVVLAEIGERVIKASSACEAFQCLLKHEIALILIDVCMPDVDGFELAELIREHPRFQKIAIIFVSAMMSAALHHLRGYELGALDYIPVPVVPELLRAKVRVFVDLYRKTRQLERFNADLARRVRERTADLQRRNEEIETRIEKRTREREAVLAQLVDVQQRETIGQLAGVAHDFNNLLMAVLASLTLLEKHLPDDARGRQLLNNATLGARRGAALSQGLLAFSRRRELKPQSVDVRELVSGMEELLKHALGFGIELDCRFPRALPPAHVSANRLELALLNAALNAPDAMAGGGRVTISASQATLDGNAGDSTPPPGDYVCIRVVGTRAGMDETARVKATASLPTHGAGGGTDLRHLVTCGISTRSGGRLEMTNRANFDAPIELWLPRAHAGTSPSTRSHCHGNFPGNFPGGCGRTFEGPQ